MTRNLVQSTDQFDQLSFGGLRQCTLWTVIYLHAGHACSPCYLQSNDKEESCKGCFYKLMQQLIVKAREEPTLNARGRKYLNTTADADPSKIGRCRDPRRDSTTTKRRFERKLVEACETGLQHMSSPLSANQSKCEGSRKGDGEQRNSCRAVS